MSDATEFRAVSLGEFMAEMPEGIKKAKTLDEFLAVNAYYRVSKRHLRSDLVWIDNDDILCIQVHGVEDYYWIKAEDRKTGDEMWRWAKQISEKVWATPEIIWDFVFLCGWPK
jgi:hypothetical protein